MDSIVEDPGLLRSPLGLVSLVVLRFDFVSQSVYQSWFFWLQVELSSRSWHVSRSFWCRDPSGLIAVAGNFEPTSSVSNDLFEPTGDFGFFFVLSPTISAVLVTILGVAIWYRDLFRGRDLFQLSKDSCLYEYVHDHFRSRDFGRRDQFWSCYCGQSRDPFWGHSDASSRGFS